MFGYPLPCVKPTDKGWIVYSQRDLRPFAVNGSGENYKLSCFWKTMGFVHQPEMEIVEIPWEDDLNEVKAEVAELRAEVKAEVTQVKAELKEIKLVLKLIVEHLNVPLPPSVAATLDPVGPAE